MQFHQNKPNLVYGILITILAYFFFAITSSFVKIIGKNFPIFEIVFFQNFISLMIILPYSLHKGTLNFKRPFLSFHIIRDITGTASYICYFFAIKYLNLVDATVLAYTAPFFTPIIWSLWMHDKIEKDVWWTIILGFIGIAFILKPSELIFHSGALLGIAAGVFSAFSLVSIRILNQKQASLSRTLLYYFIVATIITFPLAIATWKSPTLLDCLCLIIIGASTIIGQILLTIAYRHGTASFLSPLSYSIVIFILLISWIIFKQKPETLSFIGTALIVFGGTFSFVLRKRPKTFLKLFEHPNFYKRSRWGRKKKKPPE